MAQQRLQATGGAKFVELYSLQAFGAPSNEISRTFWLPATLLREMCAAVQCRVVVSGMVSVAQRQLCGELRRRRDAVKRSPVKHTPHVIGYFDGFSLWKEGTIMASFVADGVPSVDAVWTACEPTATALTAAHHIPAKAVGSATLSSWTSIPAGVIAEGERLVWTAGGNKRRVLFVGGYGTQYDAAVKIFSDVVLMLSSDDAAAAGGNSEWSFVVSPHPHTSNGRHGSVRGGLELSLLDPAAAEVVRFVPAGVSTATAAASADVIVSQGSTAGVQCLFIGKVRNMCWTNAV